MTSRRWIADEFHDDRAALLGEHAAHLARVLRARVGDEFEIAAGSVVRLGQVVSIAPDRVEFVLAQEVPQASEVASIFVALAIFKFDRFEWALEKLAELGISRILPFVAERTDRRLAAAAHKRSARWHKVLLSAAEQSRRSRPPVLEVAGTFANIIALPQSLRIVLSERDAAGLMRLPLLRLLHRAEAGAAEDVLLAIGPEGGWTDAELTAFAEKGWNMATLGNQVLRAETAAIAAASIVAAHAASSARVAAEETGARFPGKT